MAAAEHPAPSLADDSPSGLPWLFADLLTGPGCEISKTELRAIALDQLELVGKHIDRRLTDDNEVWQVSRYDNGACSQVNLTGVKTNEGTGRRVQTDEGCTY